MIDTRDAADSLRNILASGAGKPFVGWLLDQVKLYQADASFEREEILFRSGERNIGLKLIALMSEIGATVYPSLLYELTKAEADRQALLEAQTRNGDED